MSNPTTTDEERNLILALILFYFAKALITWPYKILQLVSLKSIHC